MPRGATKWAMGLVLLGGLSTSAQLAAEGPPKPGGTLRAALRSAPASLDPAWAETHAEATLAGLIYATLYLEDDEGLVAQLADGPARWDAGRWRIRLRANLRLHDGTAMTATVVAQSLARLAQSPQRWILAGLGRVTVQGDELIITGSQPGVPVEAWLALPQTGVVGGPLQGPAGVRGARVGSGPFRLVAAESQRVRLASQATAWGQPYLDTLELAWFGEPLEEARLFERGLVEVSLGGATEFAVSRPRYVARRMVSAAQVLHFVRFGQRQPWLAQPAVRQVLARLLPRTPLFSTETDVMAPALQPLPLSAATPPPPLSPAAAARLWHELGGPVREAPLEVLVDASSRVARAHGEQVLWALDVMGQPARLRLLDASELRTIVVSGAYDVALGERVLPGRAVFWWRATYADEPALAQAAVATLAARFAERLPIVPLAHYGVVAWVRNDVVGVAFDGLARLAWPLVSYSGTPLPSRRAAP